MENSKPDVAPGQDKEVAIIINGRLKTVTGHQITYEQIVALAFPDTPPNEGTVFTVAFSYEHGEDGTLVAGQHTRIKERMVINVTKTNRS